MRIAVDGPAASGKTTLAREVAEALGYLFVPTGAMYRAAALARAQGQDPARAQVRVKPGGRVYLGDEDVTESLASPALDEGSSLVAVDPRVRAHLVRVQRTLAAERGVVMEGRDIGTVVLPDAELKLFLWADPEERARRRHREQGGNFETVLQGILERDERDSTREASPLRPADDAVVLDTTEMGPDEVLARALEEVERARGRAAG